MPSNSFEIIVVLLFWSSDMLGVIKSFEQPLKLRVSHLLMNFGFFQSNISSANANILGIIV